MQIVKKKFERITRPLAKMARDLEALNIQETTAAIDKQKRAADLTAEAEAHLAEAAKANTFAKKLNELFA